MLYDMLLLVLLILIFCFFSMMLTVTAIFRMFFAARAEGTKEIKSLVLPKKTPKKTREQLETEKKAAEEKRRYETIMSNLDAYDGTEVGQKEVK